MPRALKTALQISLLTLAVSGCKYKESEFVEDFDVAYCDYVETCFEGASCDVDVTVDCGDAEYDQEKALVCIEELQDSTEACADDSPVIPLYCFEPCTEAE